MLSALKGPLASREDGKIPVRGESVEKEKRRRGAHVNVGNLETSFWVSECSCAQLGVVCP